MRQVKGQSGDWNPRISFFPNQWQGPVEIGRRWPGDNGALKAVSISSWLHSPVVSVFFSSVLQSLWSSSHLSPSESQRQSFGLLWHRCNSWVPPGTFSTGLLLCSPVAVLENASLLDSRKWHQNSQCLDALPPAPSPSWMVYNLVQCRGHQWECLQRLGRWCK